MLKPSFFKPNNAIKHGYVVTVSYHNKIQLLIAKHKFYMYKKEINKINDHLKAILALA
jgi:hypothetical protein